MHLTLDETWAPPGGRVPQNCDKCGAVYAKSHFNGCPRSVLEQTGDTSRFIASTGFDGTYAGSRTLIDMTDGRKTKATHGNAEGGV